MGTRRKSKLKDLRQRCLDKGISVAELARRIDCSRTAIYLAIERPERFSNVFARIQEVLR